MDNPVSIKFGEFEGPLDLLMHLIQTNKYDIFDIPVVSVTDQYIAALNQMQEFDMEVATEFLLMAATLLQLKSRMLLPKFSSEDEDENDDPRQQLVDMLLEYRSIKAKAAALAEMKAEADKHIAHRPMFTKTMPVLPQYTVRDLLLALASIVEDNQQDVAYIAPQAFSVEGKMEDILQRLGQVVGGVILSDFFRSGQRSEKIASFLGLLELLKAGKVVIEQKAPFDPIYIFLRKVSANGI